uniref:Uncharacterized protein n=1 Tax=Cacopsylla melanoneura TaxID=428564 RepID=A0A8D9EQ64_9HEMI
MGLKRGFQNVYEPAVCELGSTNEPILDISPYFAPLYPNSIILTIISCSYCDLFVLCTIKFILILSTYLILLLCLLFLSFCYHLIIYLFLLSTYTLYLVILTTELMSSPISS